MVYGILTRRPSIKHNCAKKQHPRGISWIYFFVWLIAAKFFGRRFSNTRLSLFQLCIPIQKIAPTVVQVIGRKSPPVFLQLGVSGPPRHTVRMHAALFGQAAALLRVACAARGHDIVPCRVPAFAARNDVIERQFRRRLAMRAVLARKTVAQKNVKPRKGGIPRRRNVFAQRDDARQLHAEGGRMNDAVVFRQNIDALQKNGFDGVLP